MWFKKLVVLIFLSMTLSCNNMPGEDISKFGNFIKDYNTKSMGLGISLISNAEVLEKLNNYRESLGLSSVDLSLNLTDGALRHTEYMLQNNIVTHAQDPTKKGYDEFGAMTGMKSVLAGNVNNGLEAIDFWMNSLYHRQYLLDPALEHIGFSFIDGFATMNLGIDSQNNENYNLDNFQIMVSEPILYPYNNQKNVPIEFNIIENPNPIPEYLTLPTGPFITVGFDKYTTIQKIIKVQVKDSKGKEISIARFIQKNKKNVFAILPEKPLPYNTKIIVSVELLVNDYNFKKIWSFITTNKS